MAHPQEVASAIQHRNVNRQEAKQAKKEIRHTLRFNLFHRRVAENAEILFKVSLLLCSSAPLLLIGFTQSNQETKTTKARKHEVSLVLAFLAAWRFNLLHRRERGDSFKVSLLLCSSAPLLLIGFTQSNKETKARKHEALLHLGFLGCLAV